MTQKSHVNDAQRPVASITGYNLSVKNQNQTQSTLSWMDTIKNGPNSL